jgi:hypothetical protein
MMSWEDSNRPKTKIKLSLFFPPMVLRIRPKATCILVKCCTTELHQPPRLCFSTGTFSQLYPSSPASYPLVVLCFMFENNPSGFSLHISRIPLVIQQEPLAFKGVLE